MALGTCGLEVERQIARRKRRWESNIMSIREMALRRGQTLSGLS